MNSDSLILRETDNLPLINKEDTLTSAEFDTNIIKIYDDFVAINSVEDSTLTFDVDRSYLVGEYCTYGGRLWRATEVSTGVTPVIGGLDWIDAFPTILAHQKNKDTILDEGGTNETTAEEIRSFIDAGLTSTTNLSLSTKTGTSFKIESSTGTDVTIPQATNIDAGLLNAEDKVKLDNQSGINTGDQTLISLNAEDVDNKVTDFTTINDTLYPTTQAVDTYITAVVPDLVETFLDSNVELNTNKATDFTTINDTLYPSVKAVDDQLDLKVDKVVGERLITSAEATILGNTSGTNTGDQIISDATISLTDITTNNFSTTKHGFVPKGTNTGKYLKDDGTWSTISAGGLTYFTEAQSTASPNSTVNVDSLTAIASTTNADFVIRPKGTGAILAAIPDNTSIGGDKRGANAVDLQTIRTSSSRVANGNYSVITGGNENTASNTYSSVLGGYLNTASGQYSSNLGGYATTVTGNYSGGSGYQNQIGGNNSFGAGASNITTANNCAVFGSTNTLSQQYCFAGGDSHTLSNFYCTAFGTGHNASGYSNFMTGLNAKSFGVHGRQSVGAYYYSTTGDNQSSTLILSARTTSATPKILGSVNPIFSTIDATTQLTLQNNNAMRVKGSIIAKQNGTTNVGAWDIDFVVVRGANAGTTAIVTSNVNLVTNASSWGTPTITADTSIGCPTITVTGVATTNIQWGCSISSMEVIY
jgi:hypothetical protein